MMWIEYNVVRLLIRCRFAETVAIAPHYGKIGTEANED